MTRAADAGAGQDAVCALCATPLPPGETVCPSCGEPAGPGERKLVTLLFADLSGYTALSSRLDPEEVYAFIRPAMIELRLIAESFGGSVPQIAGDGFMAVFGVPTAHEDDPERAVRAALALVDRVEALNRSHPGRLPLPQVHAGINTGEVLVAGSYETAGFTVIGDAVNVASRLSGVATAGQVVVSDRTRRLTAHTIRYGPRRVRRLKGKEAPIGAHRALAPLSPTPEGHVVGPRESAFVGRRDALERLAASLGTVVAADHPQVLVVVGDPGVGKTRLAAEFATSLRGATVLRGRCPPYGRDAPLAPLAAALRTHLDISADASAEHIRAAVRRLVRSLAVGEEATTLRGQLLRLLGVGADDGADSAARSEDELRVAARSVLQALARRRPVVMLLDDLHWAGEDLLGVVREANGGLWRGPVFVLGLARPELADDAARSALGGAGLPTLALGPLDRESSRALLDAALGATAPEALAEALLARAGGNPLFVEESARMLVDAGALVRRGSELVLRDASVVEEVPATLRALIAARIDRLERDEKRTLQDASIAGQVTWDALVERLAPAGVASGTRRALRALDRRDLLVRGRRVRLPKAVEHEFRSALVRDVSYGSLPRRTRAIRHRQTAEWLRAQIDAGRPSVSSPAAGELVAAVARHYEQAWSLSAASTGERPSLELTRLAAEHLGRWAELAFGAQPRLAEELFGRALEIAETRARDLDGVLRATLLTGRAECLIMLGRHRSAIAAGRAAVGLLAGTQGHADALARARLALGGALSDAGEVAEARGLLQEALRTFDEGGDIRGQARATQRLSETWRLHDFARHVELYRTAHALHRTAGDRWATAMAAQELAYLLSPAAGKEYEAFLRQARTVAEREGDPRSLAAIHRTEGYAALNRRDHAAALREAGEARLLAIEAGDRWIEVDALLIEAGVASAIGSPDEGLRLSSALLAVAAEAGAPRLRALALLASVRPALRVGRPPLAMRRLAAARRILDGLGAVEEMIEVDLTEAEMHLDRGAWARVAAPAARAELQTARLGWRLQALSPLLVGLATLGAGRPADAWPHLARAEGLAHSTGADGMLALARAASAQAALLAGDPVARVQEGRPPPESREPDVAAFEHENRGVAILAAGGSPAEAAERFAAAVEIRERMGASAWLARSLDLQAQAMRAAGDRVGAHVASRTRRSVLAVIGGPDDRVRLGARDRASPAR